jgi:Arc/MetJ family transcription regulator
MATNLAIDDALRCEALHTGNHRTKKATVNEAWREYIDRRRRFKALDLIGKIDFDPRYDYKKGRKRR